MSIDRFSAVATPKPRRPANRRVGARRGAAVVVAAALIVSLAGCGASAVGVGARDQPNRLVVATAAGTLQGQAMAGVDEYLGIPYAAPPVGPLRWQAPQPATPWKGVRNATQFAPHCAQPASAFGVASTSEDCLYLNVYTPSDATAARDLPVVVWLHGGAFIWGESDDYNPAPLVNQGVIVVTINYRLGALGFLADSALAGKPSAPAGNYGLMDQQAALRWVQHNIAEFAGNPRNVTLSGESAGGLSVLSQLASPGARGLFSQAIAQSGAYDLKPQSLSSAESAGRAFAVSVGCADQSAVCLRNLPVKTILAKENPAGYRPDIDGKVLTQSLQASFATGQFNRVPVIDGTNRDEYRLFVGLYQLAGDPVTAATYQGRIAATVDVSATTAATIAARYPLDAYPSAALALGAVGTDANFACPALRVDQSVSKYVNTYAYEFNDTNAPERYLAPVSFPYGAAHESEVQYLFELRNTANPGPFTPAQQQLASAMQHYWTNMAKGANPSSSFGATWSAFSSPGDQMLSLAVPQSQVTTDFATEHNCGFWATLGQGA